jgi:hypothetical protein
VRDLPGRELEIAEDDVLDGRARKQRATVGNDLVRLLAEEVEDDREVVNS